MDTYRLESDIRELENELRRAKSDLDYEITSRTNNLERIIDRLADKLEGLQTRIEELETLPRDS